MANLKHIEFTTEAKYQGKVKSDDTLYAVPFTSGGGGGTTLNKYTIGNLDLTTSTGRSRLYRILDGAKSIFFATLSVSNGIGSGFDELHGGGGGGVASGYGNFTMHSYYHSKNHLDTYHIEFSSTGSLNGYASNLVFDTSTNQANVILTPSVAKLTFVYYNDTEIV